MRATHLRTEYLDRPLGLGSVSPQFFWQCEGGVRQTAYRLTASKNGKTVWDTGKVESDQMTHILYGGPMLQSRDRITWTVTLWDENDRAGEVSESWFEMGLLNPADWKAQWISGDYKVKKNTRYPVDLFRKAFSVSASIASARLYATARGVYSVNINGQRLDDFVLAPGMTDYRKRIQVQTYDVTALLQKGNNMLTLSLGDGWYRGSSAAYGVTEVYGKETSVLAQLEITYENGKIETLCTGPDWDWCNDGPIRFADLKDGEIYDAAAFPTFTGKAKVVPAPKAQLVNSNNVPVKEHERFTPTLLSAKDGTQVLDFGQNVAGYLEFTVQCKRGQSLKLTCGEVLDETGHVDLHGIQESKPAKGWGQMSLIMKLTGKSLKGDTVMTPLQEIVFKCSGKEDHYKSTFTVFGFRYVQVEGEIPIDPANFAAIAVYSDMEQIGDFTCSHEGVNQLVKNTRWSMKGNFLDIPTDCPTRERLGWTGDAQIFFDTGAYLMDTAAFFKKWLTDMEDAQYKNGLLPAVLPYEGVEMMYKATGSSVGWADAVYLIPYRYYKRYGDKAVLEQYWPMMQKYGDYLFTHLGLTNKTAAKANPYNHATYEKGVHLGEWLEPEEFRDQVYGTSAKHPEECTAYLHYAMATLSEIAAILGKTDYAAKCEKLAEDAKKAYARFAELDTDRQAKLVRPLALGLLDGETRVAAQKRLKQAAENYNYKVGTGFLSTPFVLPVLAEAGEVETAYKMLLNEQRPGWLAEVKDGATTIWESWEGDLSQNHYSPGAVCQWLFEGVAGICPDGPQHFVIAPLPGPGLEHAEAAYNSLYGTVASRWERQGEQITYTVTVPANTTADIKLPGTAARTVGPGTHNFTI